MASNPFAKLPQTPVMHFKLYFYAAVLHLMEHVTRALGSFTETFERFPFLAGYHDELSNHGLDGLTLDAAGHWWRDALYGWEAEISTHLPLRALRETGRLDHAALTMLLSIGTVEEDARLLGRGVLAVDGLHKADDEWWRLVGPLATVLHAVPVVALDLGPGETASLPGVSGYDGPMGVVLSRQGGLSGAGAERALTLTLEMPDAQARCRHWWVGLGAHAVGDLEAIGERLRLTSGNIRRAAPLAISYAALDQRTTVTLADVQQASRTLNRQVLDTLATRVNTSGDWNHLAVGALTLPELSELERRCRNRERLPSMVGAALGAQLNVGVRALFSGPSGTGKTLAARLLAAELQMDLYRLDLSAVVNKYIGETEKSLNQILSRAEELDVILLLDEGDALLTQRTSVQTSNDRYANLETNYLLQRLEAFEGILDRHHQRWRAHRQCLPTPSRCRGALPPPRGGGALAHLAVASASQPRG